MKSVLLVLQIIVSGLLTAAILVQARGTGFGRSFGGGGSFTRRGLEKLVFRATFVLVAVFVIFSILQLLI